MDDDGAERRRRDVQETTNRKPLAAFLGADQVARIVTRLRQFEKLVEFALHHLRIRRVGRKVVRRLWIVREEPQRLARPAALIAQCFSSKRVRAGSVAKRSDKRCRPCRLHQQQQIRGDGRGGGGVEPLLTPEEAVAQLRALRERIPEFVQLPNTPSTREPCRKARLNVEFAREAFGVVGASEVVQGVIGNSPDELHQTETEMGRWIAVESELNALLRGVAAANLVRRERLAEPWRGQNARHRRRCRPATSAASS